MESESPIWTLKKLRGWMNKPLPQNVDVTDFAATGNKQTLVDLNKRLKKHLEDVERGKNIPTQQKIDEAEKQELEGYWNQTNNILDDIKKMTIENAKKLVEIQTTNLDKEEYSRKLEEEKKLHGKLKNELKYLENTGLEQQKQSLNKTIKQLQNDLQILETCHKSEVDNLVNKLKNDSENTNWAEIVKRIRENYEDITRRNMTEIKEETSKFQKAQQEETQNLDLLNSKKQNLKDLYVTKGVLEVEIETCRTTIDNLHKTQEETRKRVSGLEEKRDDLKNILQALITEIEDYENKNQGLFSKTESLKEQIQEYKRLVESRKKPDPAPTPDQTKKKNPSNDKEEKKKDPKAV